MKKSTLIVGFLYFAAFGLIAFGEATHSKVWVVLTLSVASVIVMALFGRSIALESEIAQIRAPMKMLNWNGLTNVEQEDVTLTASVKAGAPRRNSREWICIHRTETHEVEAVQVRAQYPEQARRWAALALGVEITKVEIRKYQKENA